MIHFDLAADEPGPGDRAEILRVATARDATWGQLTGTARQLRRILTSPTPIVPWQARVEIMALAARTVLPGYRNTAALTTSHYRSMLGWVEQATDPVDAELRMVALRQQVTNTETERQERMGRRLSKRAWRRVFHLGSALQLIGQAEELHATLAARATRYSDRHRDLPTLQSLRRGRPETEDGDPVVCEGL